MTNFLGHKSLNEIPIFFSTDDNYLPYLDVAIRSLIKNASKDYKYRIVILNTGLVREKMDKIKKLANENFIINFVDISHSIEDIKHQLRNVYHFGLASYYRLFIEQLFPEYDKILYLDCDIVVLGDISKLYHTDMEENAVAGVVEQFILHSPVFSLYTNEAVGIDSEHYINSGILLMDLAKLREMKMEEKFVELLTTYNFDVIDPDQAYINYLCKDKIKYLPVEWNRTPIETVNCEKPQIIHYALGIKPWQKNSIFLANHFWDYAKESSFYDDILESLNKFDTLAELKKQRAAIDIQIQAIEYANSKNTFNKVLNNSNIGIKLVIPLQTNLY